MEKKEVIRLINYQLISISANFISAESGGSVEIKTTLNINIIDRSNESVKVAISQKIFFSPANFFRLEIEHHADFKLLDGSVEDAGIKDAIGVEILPILAQSSLLTAIISEKFEGVPLIVSPDNS